MATIRIASGLLALAGLAATSAAQAQNVVYEGDCNRARIVQAESTIDKLMPFTRYKGTQVINSTDLDKGTCVVDDMIVFELVQTSRSSSAVVFSTRRNDVGIGTGAGGCMAPSRYTTDVTGTVTFETKLETKDQLCELYISAKWKDTMSDFVNRVIPLAGGAFVLAQGAPTAKFKASPMGFVGLP